MPDEFGNLIADVDEMLTDSRHPLDEQQARRMSLMLLRQVYNVQLKIQREIADWKADVSTRREQVNVQIAGIRQEVQLLESHVREIERNVSGLDKSVKDVEKIVPWVKGLAWFATAVGLALIGALVRMVIP